MKRLLKKHIYSFKYAIEGLSYAFINHANYRIHAVLSILALYLSYIFGISRIEWIVIINTIILGLVIETINTAIEATTDAIDRNERKDIKIAKDTAAAAMLIYSFGALIVAILIFLPHL